MKVVKEDKYWYHVILDDWEYDGYYKCEEDGVNNKFVSEVEGEFSNGTIRGWNIIRDYFNTQVIVEMYVDFYTGKGEVIC